MAHTDKHLIEKDAHRPPVTFTTILCTTTLGLENLRRYIVWCTDSRV